MGSKSVRADERKLPIGLGLGRRCSGSPNTHTRTHIHTRTRSDPHPERGHPRAGGRAERAAGLGDGVGQDAGLPAPRAAADPGPAAPPLPGGRDARGGGGAHAGALPPDPRCAGQAGAGLHLGGARHRQRRGEAQVREGPPPQGTKRREFSSFFFASTHMHICVCTHPGESTIWKPQAEALTRFIHPLSTYLHRRA